MTRVGHPAPPLDTLAQLSQRTVAEAEQRLLRRARAKCLTVPLSVTLAELRSPLEKSYRNSVYCADTLEQGEDGRVRGTYCGNRWCLVCNRVRTARAIDRYLPAIESWADPQLVTLTIRNVAAEELSRAIEQMLHELLAIGRAIKRTDRLPLRALRKLECTYNAERDDYHPHFHIAVEGTPQANGMRGRWLGLHPEASPQAQDVRPCDISALKELFKYFTKIIAKRPGMSSRAVAPAVALDVIFSAMKGRRVYQPMGFKIMTAAVADENAKVGISDATAAYKRLGDFIQWEWAQELHDWVDFSTGEVLTGYEPTEAFRELIRGIC
jgi:hypothetical protein